MKKNILLILATCCLTSEYIQSSVEEDTIQRPDNSAEGADDEERSGTAETNNIQRLTSNQKNIILQLVEKIKYFFDTETKQNAQDALKNNTNIEPLIQSLKSYSSAQRLAILNEAYNSYVSEKGEEGMSGHDQNLVKAIQTLNTYFPADEQIVFADEDLQGTNKEYINLQPLKYEGQPSVYDKAVDNPTIPIATAPPAADTIDTTESTPISIQQGETHYALSGSTATYSIDDVYIKILDLKNQSLEPLAMILEKSNGSNLEEIRKEALDASAQLIRNTNNTNPTLFKQLIEIRTMLLNMNTIA